MNSLLEYTIAASETLSAHIRATGRQPCSIPVLVDLPAGEDCTGLAGTCLTAWLNEDEKKRFRQFKLEKRKRQWLAGRFCAKIAMQEYFSTYYPDGKIPACTEFSIANSDTGRPFATWKDGLRLHEAPDISISHSGSLALALAARTCCGVDIQEAGETILRVKERFCIDREERLLVHAARKNTPLMRQTLLWAAKEAARKALSISNMPGFLDLILVRVEEFAPEERVFTFERYHRQARVPSEIKVVTAICRGYGLGICIP